MPSARPAIVSRIKANMPEFKTVIGTANVKSVLRQGWSAPACFVFRSGRERESAPGCVKQFQVSYTVLLVMKIDKDDGTQDETAEALSDAVAALLDNWAPVDANALVYQGGEAMTDLERNLLFWKDTYNLTQFL
jgi:hypothetical protein